MYLHIYLWCTICTNYLAKERDGHRERIIEMRQSAIINIHIEEDFFFLEVNIA